MARLDVFRNSGGDGYLLDLQSDLLHGLNTRVVAPLMYLSDAPIPAKRLNPVFEVEGHEVVMVTQYLASVSEIELKEYVTDLRSRHKEVVDALDMLYLGF
ncbi:CcdB family protein [Vibrio sp. SCSIO 43137]|uniref:CcdB family protein n=1 Tax=Vibrio sp. SCSIO 43137 TaxID=3021011 RepID=UPI002306E8DD|nr:CcdB family protein [Vibrio sp. SCSIO 43137]WCE28897.1 CcdB family protein [Vibrio sp. SCSIO 43137]